MEALLGFHVGFWDYVTFGAMAVIVMAFLALAVFILGLPGRIAIARKHPEADAIYQRHRCDDRARAAISRMVNKPIHAAVMPRTGRPRLVAANPWTNR
jgi:hypothetical protein